MNCKWIQYLARAMRLPFVAASALPFIFGSLLSKNNFNLLNFFLGLSAVIFTHLGANLINDYADSKSGADWKDTGFYGFFGGSKLIQSGVLTERFYFNLSITCFFIAAASVLTLAFILKSPLTIFLYIGILLLAWSYSAKPLQFSYHRMGEIIIFILFGPVPVMGGYFIQTKIFPTLEGFLLSLPFGFLTASILIANEIPDLLQDKEAGKLTWVSLVNPETAFLLYLFLQLLAFQAIGLGIIMGYLNPIALFSFISVVFIIKAAGILKESPGDKNKLVQSSKITIAVQALVSIVLIMGLAI